MRRENNNMSTLNVILLIIGIMILILGIIWSKKNWTNVLVKLLLIFSGAYVGLYALYLSNILIVINK